MRKEQPIAEIVLSQENLSSKEAYQQKPLVPSPVGRGRRTEGWAAALRGVPSVPGGFSRRRGPLASRRPHHEIPAGQLSSRPALHQPWLVPKSIRSLTTQPPAVAEPRSPSPKRVPERESALLNELRHGLATPTRPSFASCAQPNPRVRSAIFSSYFSLIEWHLFLRTFHAYPTSSCGCGPLRSKSPSITERASRSRAGSNL